MIEHFFRVQEIFDTIQGEGMTAGTPSTFVRLHGCPVGCSFCDTGYGGKANIPSIPLQKLTIPEIIARVNLDRSRPFVTITGGEPMAQDITPICYEFIDRGVGVSIETSGAFWRDLPDSVHVTLSPKEHLNPNYPVKPQFWERANEVKIVIANGNEWDFYSDRVQDGTPIYFQPEWENRDRSLSLIRPLLDRVPDSRLSVQTHKYLGIA